VGSHGLDLKKGENQDSIVYISKRKNCERGARRGSRRSRAMQCEEGRAYKITVQRDTLSEAGVRTEERAFQRKGNLGPYASAEGTGKRFIFE